MENTKQATGPFPKRYYSKVSGARYIMPDGQEILFIGGRYDFHPDNFPGHFTAATFNNQTDPRNGQSKAKIYQDELEHLVKTGNPLIYDADHASNFVASNSLPPLLDPTKNAQSEAQIQATDSRLPKGVVTGDLNVAANPGTVSDPNASTASPDLQQMFAKAAGHAGAERIAALKAAGEHKPG